MLHAYQICKPSFCWTSNVGKNITTKRLRPSVITKWVILQLKLYLNSLFLFTSVITFSLLISSMQIIAPSLVKIHTHLPTCTHMTFTGVRIASWQWFLMSPSSAPDNLRRRKLWEYLCSSWGLMGSSTPLGWPSPTLLSQEHSPHRMDKGKWKWNDNHVPRMLIPSV